MAARWKTASASATTAPSGSERRSMRVEAEARPAPQAGEIAFLHGPGVVGDEGVQADDLVAERPGAVRTGASR